MNENIKSIRNTAKVILAIQASCLIIFELIMILMLTKVINTKIWWISIVLGILGVYIFGMGVFACVLVLTKVKNENFDKKIIKTISTILWLTLNRSLTWLVWKLKKEK
ncbi:MAG: hypothetical protein GY679_03185 [Mycoplasma sp.]|nr:hypothetical protein [Mycoplasma sp.]